MHIAMASSAGHAGRSNEDFVGAVPGCAVLLDGTGGIPGSESICRHGVAWYTHRLGAALLGRLSRDDGRELGVLLAESIDEIAGNHRGSCDLPNPSSPQATVLVVRARAGEFEYLLLADSYLVLDTVGSDPRTITDGREVAVRSMCAAPLEGIVPGTAEYSRVYAGCADELRARRNRPGGYWIAKDDPRAAAEAVTGRWPLAQMRAAALLSNGASRIVDPYGLTDWAGVLDLLDAHGPDELVRRLRAVEAGGTDTDDATVAHCTWVPASAPRLPFFQ